MSVFTGSVHRRPCIRGFASRGTPISAKRRRPPDLRREVCILKTLYIIGGPMGAGKTTVCQVLKKTLPDSVFLDGDWCWDAHPFQVTEETKQMVLRNIRFLLGQFLRCSAYRYVIFCWVLHEQAILDAVLDGLDLTGCAVKNISLLCSEAELRARLQRDVASGLRTEDVIGRSLARLPAYAGLPTVKIDTTGRTPAEVAAQIAAL